MESFYRQFQSWVRRNAEIPVLPLCIVGNIGVGKSTFVNTIKEATKNFPNTVVVTEPIEDFSMIFNRFCNAPSTAANWQLANLNHFSSVMIEYIEKARMAGKQFIVVFERSPFCCRNVFLPLQRGMADKNMLSIVDAMKETVCNSTGWKNAFIVCLDFTDTTKAMKRIAFRDRTGEAGISPDYWNAINEKYHEMMTIMSMTHSTLIVDVTDFNLDQVYEASRLIGGHIEEVMIPIGAQKHLIKTV
jgi:deoxyadenosine/deoxycytidine kinase